MAETKVEQVLALIEGMTILEVAELVKAMEAKFGISAAAPVAVAAAPAAGAAPAAAPAEEKTEFTVVLKDIGANKINVIKAVRELTNLGLKESKELSKLLPSQSKKMLTKTKLLPPKPNWKRPALLSKSNNSVKCNSIKGRPGPPLFIPFGHLPTSNSPTGPAF